MNQFSFLTPPDRPLAAGQAPTPRRKTSLHASSRSLPASVEDPGPSAAVGTLRGTISLLPAMFSHNRSITTIRLVCLKGVSPVTLGQQLAAALESNPTLTALNVSASDLSSPKGTVRLDSPRSAALLLRSSISHRTKPSLRASSRPSNAGRSRWLISISRVQELSGVRFGFARVDPRQIAIFRPRSWISTCATSPKT